MARETVVTATGIVVAGGWCGEMMLTFVVWATTGSQSVSCMSCSAGPSVVTLNTRSSKRAVWRISFAGSPSWFCIIVK